MLVTWYVCSLQIVRVPTQESALAWSAVAGFACSVLFGAPRGAPPIELLFVGRRPPAGG